jgi:Eukaryotic glutathione synthase, ATP binding domain
MHPFHSNITISHYIYAIVSNNTDTNNLLLAVIGVIVDIYETVSDEVVRETVHLGLHRSDYMINIDKFGVEKPLQVEINTIASSFGCLSKKVGDFHRFLMLRNADSDAYKNLLLQTGSDPSLQVNYFFHHFFILFLLHFSFISFHFFTFFYLYLIACVLYRI